MSILLCISLKKSIPDDNNSNKIWCSYIRIVNESTSMSNMSTYRHNKKNEERKKNKQRYVWHVVSCVTEKKHEKKRENDWFCSLPYSFFVDNVTHALCHYRKTSMKRRIKKVKDLKVISMKDTSTYFDE